MLNFYPNFYEYEMFIEGEVCLFSLLFQITVNSLFRISLISFSQHMDYITVKLFLMRCIQFNQNLASRPKIDLALRVLKRKPLDFVNAPPMSLLSSSLYNFSLLENRMTVKLSNGLIVSNSELVSWPNTGRIKL